LAGISNYSAKTFNRPQWKILLSYLKKHKGGIDLLIFSRWDRFSRNMFESLATISLLESLGVKICCVEAPMDLSIPESKVGLVNSLLLPEVENTRRSISTKNGMIQAAMQGYFLGIAPVGYDNFRTVDEKSTLIIVPEVGPIVKKALEEFSSGHFTAEEIRRKYFGPDSVRPVSKQTFLNMLRNPTYAGKIAVPSIDGSDPILVEGKHQPLISMTTYMAIQQALKRKNKIRIVKDRDEFPLRGLLICPLCGRISTASWSKSRNGNKYPFYHCLKGCKFRVPGNSANEQFREFLNGFVLKPEVYNLYKLVLDDLIKELDADRIKELKTIDSKIKELKKSIEHFDTQMMYRKMDSETYARLYNKCHHEMTALEEQRKFLFESNKETITNFKSALGVHSSLVAIFELADIREKKEIIGSIFPDKLTFHGNKYRTADAGQLAQHIFQDINTLEKNKMKKETISDLLSKQAPPPGLEPGTP